MKYGAALASKKEDTETKNHHSNTKATAREMTVVFLTRLTENRNDNKNNNNEDPVRETDYSSLSSKEKKILSGQ